MVLVPFKSNSTKGEKTKHDWLPYNIKKLALMGKGRPCIIWGWVTDPFWVTGSVYPSFLFIHKEIDPAILTPPYCTQNFQIEFQLNAKGN